MASRYWVGGTGNWDATTTHWSASSGGASGATAPTATDDVFFDANSGASAVVTVVAGGGVCQNFTATGFTGSFTISGANLTINGNATFAGRTYSGTNGIIMNSTAAATRTITSGGATISVTQGLTLGPTGVAGSSTWSFQDAITVAQTLTFNSGTLLTNGFAMTWGVLSSQNSNTRTLNITNSQVTITAGGTAWTTLSASSSVAGSNLTTITTGSTITFTGLSAQATGLGVGGTLNNVVFSGGGPTMSIGTPATPVCVNLTITGTANKTDAIAFSSVSVYQITGTLTATGNSVTNRLLLAANPISGASWGDPARGNVSAAAVSIANCDFADVKATGAAVPWTGTGGVGDCGGNSGITFTPAATQTWNATSGGNYSDVTKWSGSPARVPLPQDDVIFQQAFVGAALISFDMPRAGRNHDFTGSTIAGTSLGCNWITTASTIFGSLTLISGMANSAGATQLTFAGRGNHTIAANGSVLGAGAAFCAAGGTYTLATDLTTGSIGVPRSIAFICGTLDLNGRNLTCLSFIQNVANTAAGGRTLKLGSGTLTITGTGNVYWIQFATTVIPGTGTITLTDVSATGKTIFCGGASPCGNHLTIPGGGGTLSVNASTFAGTVTITGPKTVTITQTQTFGANAFVLNASAGNLITINSSVVGTRATMSSSTTVNADYLSVTDITAAGVIPFGAGAHSTLSNSVNWVLGFVAFASDTVAVSDGAVTSLGSVRGASDSVTVSDAAARALALGRTANDQIAMPSVGYRESALADTPSLYWRLNEASGNFADSSGNGRSSYATFGTNTYRQPGLINDLDTCVLFNGGIQGPSGYAPFQLGSSITFECWCVRVPPIQYCALVKSSLDNAGPLLSVNDAGDVQWSFSATNVLWSGVFPQNAVVHVALTYNDATRVAELFLNGVSQGTRTISVGYSSMSGIATAQMSFPGGAWNAAWKWVGRVDEIAVYPSTLSSSRVAAHYTAGTIAPTAKPDSASAQKVSFASGSDGWAISDAGSHTLQTFARTSADSCSVSDAASRSTIARARTSSDSVSVSDQATRTARQQLSALDSWAVSDSASRAGVTRGRTSSDSVTVSDAAVRLSARQRLTFDSWAVADSAARGAISRTRAAVDHVAISDRTSTGVLRRAFDVVVISDSAFATFIAAPGATWVVVEEFEASLRIWETVPFVDVEEFEAAITIEEVD